MNLSYLFYILLGYVLGSMLFSNYIPRIFRGVDITKVSPDHNPGTANAMKYAGVPVGVACLFCDVAKGFIPVFMAARHCDPYCLAFAAVLDAPVLGHAFSAFHRLKGGKAVATSFGVLLGLLPNYILLAILAGSYLFFSIVVVIRPNERRSVFSFFVFAAASVAASMLHLLPVSIVIGAVFIAIVAIVKNYDYKSVKAKENHEQKEKPFSYIK